ncbi:MAG: radical SAM family heme chaperone HemW [Oscillibacter sp.]|nr:radical SAM family heme chaperone HemW [Oscillibacter sp.]
MRKLGLYIHVPFCKSKCAYCDFYSLAGAEERMDDYADALIAQLEAFAPRAAARVVDTVYVGGGTPSYLGAARLVRILQAVRGLYAVAPDAEITAEANPDSVGGWFAELRAAGYNRVSLGAQSFDNALLRAVGRVHTAEQAADAVKVLRRAGFENVSLDLIYGLPGETAQSWRESVERAAELLPEHMSCYGLKVEPGTPLCSRRDLPFPDDDAQAERYLRAVDALSRRGYRQYEVSNFAKPGYESRHNLKYWTLGEYLGFGAGAHSDFDGERFAWARDLGAFVRRDWARSESSAISPRERAREWLMLGLRTSDGVPLSEYAARFGRAFDAGFLSQCVKAGYAAADGGRVSLTARGFLVSNQIIARALELSE